MCNDATALPSTALCVMLTGTAPPSASFLYGPLPLQCAETHIYIYISHFKYVIVDGYALEVQVQEQDRKRKRGGGLVTNYTKDTGAGYLLLEANDKDKDADGKEDGK